MTKKKVIHFDFKVKLKSIKQTVPFRLLFSQYVRGYISVNQMISFEI